MPRSDLQASPPGTGPTHDAQAGRHGVAGRLARLRHELPDGRGLPERAWRIRHRSILVLLWLHVPVLFAFGLYQGTDEFVTGAHFTGQGIAHVLQEMLVLAAFATAASIPRFGRRTRSVAASLGLVAASGLLVHFSGGYIEAHFHFFVMVGIIALYHDWVPFTVSILFVALHHGIAGTLDPASVYNHAAAVEHPWRWALIHAFFILGLSTAEVVHWRASERALARTDLVLRSAGDGIIGIDPAGTVIFANPAAARLVGRSPGEDLVGRAAADLFPDRRAVFVDEAGRLRGADGAEADGRDIVVTAAGGDERRVAWKVRPLGVTDGAEGVVVTLKDVTERHRHAEQLAAQRRELQDAQRIACIGSFRSDPVTRRVTMSEELLRILGLPLDRPTVSSALLHDALHPDDRDLVVRAVERARHGQDPGATVQVAHRVVRPDGTVRHVQLRGELGPAANPEARPFIGTLRDVTEQVLAEEAKRIAVEQRREIEVLKERDAFKTRVLNAIAHELNTPLTPVKLQLHVLRTQAHGPLNERQQRSLHLVGRNLSRFGNLVRDLLDAARLDGGDLRVEAAPVRLDAVVREAVESYEQPARAAGIRLGVGTLPEVWVEGDAGRLGQVLDNLLSNAVKFTPAGGTVTVGMGADPQHVQAWVEDSGPGISKDEMTRLFQPFSQIPGKARGVDEGTGLGLYLARAIVERHHGTIGCTSDGAGRGCRFVFELPRCSAPGDAVEGSPVGRERHRIGA